MKLIRTISITLCSAGLSGLYAATPIELQPYLEYAPLQTRVGMTAGTGGMSHAVLILDLRADQARQRMPAIFVSEYNYSPNSVVAFNGADGKPLKGWGSGEVRPVGSSSGIAYLSGSAQPSPRVIAAFSEKPALIVTEFGQKIGQFTQGNYYSSAMAIGGHVPDSRHDFTAAYFGGEDYKVHRVSLFTENEVPGWPKTHSNSAQRVTTPALLEINGDTSPEVFSAAGNSSAGFEVRAHDGTTGNLLWVRQFSSGYAANYVAIGQVLPDMDPELIVVHRNGTTSGSRLFILDALTGAVDGTVDLPGTISYGSAPALADLNGDGLDDLVVATESFLSAIAGGTLQQLPGFPTNLGSVWLGDSAPVIGDIGGPSGAEIVLTTRVPGSDSSEIHIINKNGTYMLPRQSMVLGGGMTNAIHNLDDDGHNELVIAARGAPTIGLQDSLWVLDFSQNELVPSIHDPVLWGQFGQNAERCNCSKLALEQAMR